MQPGFSTLPRWAWRGEAWPVPMDLPALVHVRGARHLADSGMAKAIRLDSNLALAEVAAALNVSATTLYRWEEGICRPRGEAAIRYYKLLCRLQESK
jgi:hypothetical protein